MESYSVQIYKFEQQVKVYNDAIKAFEVAKTLADKFNGKVINKRFITAINKACEEAFGKQMVNFSLYNSGYSYSHKQNVTELEIYLYDRCKCYDGGCIYIDNDRLRVYELDSNGDCYINADGRLDKEVFLKAIDKQIANCKDAMGKYQYCIDNFEAILDKVREENKRLEALQKEIPYPMHMGTARIELPFWY
jgi:hypothetical protein